jgi:hypothetical protein
MAFLAAACSVLTAVLAWILLRRLWAASQDGQARLQTAVAPDDFPHRVLQLVGVGLDTGLLADAGSGGLADVAVRSRESLDRYQSVGQLLDWLAREAPAKAYPELTGLIKGVYQLGHSLRSEESAVHHCQQPLLARLLACNVGGSPVARVECVRPGTMLDPRTMASLNYGARVVQPLGVIVYDASGKVLGKAKVLCG